MAKKRGMGKHKGNAFERKVSKQLSLWWTHGKHDDIFWRTDTSGGRATIRKGKRTYGQHGDICARHESGTALTELCTIECKHGYVKDSLADLIDRQERQKPTYLKFIMQATKEKRSAKTPYWLLITQRTGREPLVLFPHDMLMKLFQYQSHFSFFNLSPNFRLTIKVPDKKEAVWIAGTSLSEFTRWINPKCFILLHDKWKHHLARKRKQCYDTKNSIS
ncbi:MAG: hypothetical protein JRC90_10640 [Deltaproteobacteria bacterium]|nr:hypothetical protein [Deltaproteobacteria bacterium]